MDSIKVRVISCLIVGLVGFYSMYKTTKIFPLGLTTIQFVDNTRVFDTTPRVLSVFVWYPIQAGTPTQKVDYDIWKIRDAAKDALPVAGKLPLILFSHGYSGHPYANSWFAEYLAAQGYIVASVQHYGNSFPESMIPELSVRPWNRPQNMSVVLDQLLEHPVFKDRIDTARIGAAGFSQGAVTALWLAGITAHLTKDMLQEQFTFINDPFLRSRHFKNFSKERLDSVLVNFTQEDFDQANRSYRDERIKAVVALAPGIDRQNPMFSKEGLAHVQVPVYIIVGEEDDVALAQFFAQYIPQCTLSILPGKITHWTLLNEATEQGKKINPFITVDDLSVDRARVHEKVGSVALHFFNDKLSVAH